MTGKQVYFVCRFCLDMCNNVMTVNSYCLHSFGWKIAKKEAITVVLKKQCDTYKSMRFYTLLCTIFVLLSTQYS